MTDIEKLTRDMETLLESIRVAWREIADGIETRPENMPAIRSWCVELRILVQRLDEVKWAGDR
jgi:hypothetical protein